MNDFTLVRKNLFRRKLRAILMIVSILVAFLIFGVLAGVYASFTAGEDRAAADRLVVVNKLNFTQPLPIAYYNRIRSVAGVRQVTHANWFGGYYQDPKNFLIVMAVDPETYTDIFSRDFDFAPEARQAFIRTRTGAVVGEMGVVIDIPRSATVTALVPTESLELDAPNFERVAKAYPILHRVVARLLSERLRATETAVGGSQPS